MAQRDKWLILKGLTLIACFLLCGFYTTYHLMERTGNLFPNDNLFPVLNIERRAHKERPTTDVRDTGSSVSSSISTEGDANHPQTSSQWTSSSSFARSEASSSSSSSSLQPSTPSQSPSTATPGALTRSETVSSSTTTVPPSCTDRRYPIKDSCAIDDFIQFKYGSEITLEEIGDMLFSLPILDRLMDTCEPGDWCVADDWGLVSDDDDFFDFCTIGNCLNKEMTDDCLNQERRLYLSTLSVLCDSAKANATDICFLSIRKMTLVTLALLKQQLANKTTETCTAINTSSNCTETCHEFAKGLFCMCQICDHLQEIFKPFKQWQWYFQDDTDADVCQITNNTDCSYLASPTESWFDNVLGKLNRITITDVSDGKILSAVIISGLVMLTGLVLSVWACVRKDCKFRGYTRNRVEYMEVDEEEDVYD